MGNASKGYRPNRKVYKLRFEDDDYDGLIVRARSVSVGALLDVAALVGIDPRDIRQDDLERLFATFAAALIEWNLEGDQGEPVPATLDGVKSQDADFVMPIIKAWFDGIAGVSGPLGQGSSAGGRSAAPPLPMEPLSESQAS